MALSTCTRRLALALLLVSGWLAVSGCQTVSGIVNDDNEAKIAREELLRQAPLGTHRGDVVGLLRENHYRMMSRTGKPFTQLAGEYLYAYRFHKISQMGYRRWELGLRFENDVLAEVVSRSVLRDTDHIEPGDFD